jgi:pimeloyl-ACP methyl ester carboxylesterase
MTDKTNIERRTLITAASGAALSLALMSKRAAAQSLDTITSAASGHFEGAEIKVGDGSGAPLLTIVLVHGAFAESSSTWNPVLGLLLAKGYKVVAAPNPLRGVSSDGAYVSSILKTIDGPIIVVGHSYGGAVITAAANGNRSVKALVYVAAFAPDTGESVAELLRRFPGSTIVANAAAPIQLADGSRDLYLQPDKFRAQFAADLPETETKLMAATQRPMAERAMTEPSGVAAWKAIPSWFIFGTRDNAIPAGLQAFMAERAGSKKTVTIEGASHAVMISHADSVVELVEQAAAAVGGDEVTAPR